MVHFKTLLIVLLALSTSQACEQAQEFPEPEPMIAYVPTPAPLPASIMLPQDVVDDVVVATVNPQVQICLDTLAALDVWEQGGTINLTDDATVDIAATKTLTLDGRVSVANLSIQAGTNTLINGGSSQFNGGVEVTAGNVLRARGTVILGDPGGVDFQGPVFANTIITLQGDGKIAGRNKTIAAAGNQTVLAAKVDQVWIPSGVMNNGDLITIDDTGATDGMVINFATDDSTNSIGACSPGLVITVPLKSASGFYHDTQFTRIGGVWKATRLAKM